MTSTRSPLDATRLARVYLYAIVRTRPRKALGRGLSGQPLVATRAGGALVIVEKGVVAPKPDAASLRAHDRIVRRIASASTALLPFRFGSVVPDLATLRDSLEPVSVAIADALASVDDCVQFTLRVFGEAANAAPAPARKAGPGTQWLDAKLHARRVPEIAPLTAAAAAFVRDTRSSRHDRPPLLASVYHLVPKKEKARYKNALARAAAELRGVEVSLAGPFPPYAFADLGGA